MLAPLHAALLSAVSLYRPRLLLGPALEKAATASTEEEAAPKAAAAEPLPKAAEEVAEAEKKQAEAARVAVARVRRLLQERHNHHPTEHRLRVRSRARSGKLRFTATAGTATFGAASAPTGRN